MLPHDAPSRTGARLGARVVNILSATGGIGSAALKGLTVKGLYRFYFKV
jgi:hypothetical protein